MTFLGALAFMTATAMPMIAAIGPKPKPAWAWNSLPTNREMTAATKTKNAPRRINRIMSNVLFPRVGEG